MSKFTAAQIWDHLNQLTKPPGSLGQLERLAARMCEIQGTIRPVSKPRRAVLFAADHGVVAAGVSAWPSKVTRLMIDNIRSGGAASSVLAKESGTELRVVDVGALPRDPSQPSVSVVHASHVAFRDAAIRPISDNLANEPAMSPRDFDKALRVGREEAKLAAEDGMKVLLAGEMGIGNTTPASCLTMLLADVSLADAVGPGAGADPETVARKRQVVRAAVERVREKGRVTGPESIASVAGFEIVAMAGFFIEASRQDLTVVLDGYVSTAAALVAKMLAPECVDSMIAAHRSAEPGHAGGLAALDLAPMLDWQLRLGEGSGALLLVPMLDAAAAICTQMSSFSDLGMTQETSR